MNEPRVLSITPVHPSPQKRETQETHPTHLVVHVDTGLKSGRLTSIPLTLKDAMRLNQQLASGILICWEKLGTPR